MLLLVATLGSQGNGRFSGRAYRKVLNRASQVQDDERLGGCCAPSTTSPMSVVYLDKDNQLANEVIRDVVIDGCECV